MNRVPFDQARYDEATGLTLHDGKPFTGVVVSHDLDGILQGEVEYRDGLRSGLFRSWHRDGRLAAEGTFRHGALQGTFREWHENGQLAVEQFGDCGVLLSERKWDEQGRVTREYTLEPGGPDWSVLQHLRAAFGDEPPEGKGG